MPIAPLEFKRKTDESGLAMTMKVRFDKTYAWDHGPRDGHREAHCKIETEYSSTGYNIEVGKENESGESNQKASF